MEDEDKEECSDTEPVKDPSTVTVIGVICLLMVGMLGLIATTMPFAMAWSRWLTNYFGL